MTSPSTGPRTAHGKAIASQNARTHGLTAKHLKISFEDQPIFDSLQDSLNRELLPQGELENTLFDRILRAHWDLYRLDSIEAQLLENFDPFNDSHSITLNRLALYRTRTENGLYKATTELRKLQEERHLRSAALDDPNAFSPIVNVASVQKSFTTLNRLKKNRTPPHQQSQSDSDRHTPILNRDFRYDQG